MSPVKCRMIIDIACMLEAQQHWKNALSQLVSVKKLEEHCAWKPWKETAYDGRTKSSYFSIMIWEQQMAIFNKYFISIMNTTWFALSFTELLSNNNNVSILAINILQVSHKNRFA